jgi:hypothetical protein
MQWLDEAATGYAVLAWKFSAYLQDSSSVKSNPNFLQCLSPLRRIVITLGGDPITTFITFSRHNRNGVVDSVCILCQQPIASGLNVMELIPSEIAHTCTPAQIILSRITGNLS